MLLRPAAAVICVSETLAAAVRAAGLDSVVVPNGVRIPEEVGTPAEPLEVLYVGRLSPEKNIDTLLEAAGDFNLVVAATVRCESASRTRSEPCRTRRWSGCSNGRP